MPTDSTEMKSTEAIIAELGETDSGRVRNAQQALVTKGKEPLLCALGHSNPKIRANAAHALAWLGDPSTAAQLCGALQDTDRHVRMRAAYALGQIGDKSATSALVGALGDDDSIVRSSAIEALSLLEAHVAVPEILKALEEENPSVKRRAIAALGSLKAESAVPTILLSLGDDRRYVRETALIALAQIYEVNLPDGKWTERAAAAELWWEEVGRDVVGPNAQTAPTAGAAGK